MSNASWPKERYARLTPSQYHYLVDYLRENPDEPLQRIVDWSGVAIKTLHTMAKEHGIKRKDKTKVIRDLRKKDNRSLEAIAKKHGLSTAWVSILKYRNFVNRPHRAPSIDEKAPSEAEVEIAKRWMKNNLKKK